jgi:hypothetical protein
MNLRKRPPARTRLTWTLGLLLALAVAGCAPARPVDGLACATRRLEVARSLYESARTGLARYFRQREDFALTEAYLASQDAAVLARATRGCWDFDELSRRQAIDLIKASLLFQKLVVSNMRDQDPGVVVDLYGREYREIFRSDLH